MLVLTILTNLLVATLVAAQRACPGYRAADVTQSSSGLTANLYLAGSACNVFGQDLPNLTLTVEYQTGKICVPLSKRYMETDSTHSLSFTCNYPGQQSDSISGSKECLT